MFKVIGIKEKRTN